MDILGVVGTKGLASHLVLDWLTNYGTELLWPLSDKRFALSWVFIVDPYVWAILGVGLWAILRKRQERMAKAALAIAGAYFLFCGVLRAHALHVYRAGGVTGRTDAFPQAMDPLHWTIVRDDGMALHWVNGPRNDTFVQFHDEELLPKAEATEAVKLFRWFAAFPLVEKMEESGRTVLRYRDLRFRSRMPWGGVSEGMFVVAKVVFDAQGDVVSARLESDQE